MRYKMIAAAAASLLAAGQASAATFVQYEASGTGFVVRQTGAGYEVKAGDFFFNFVVETDPGYSSGDTYGDGTTYSYGTYNYNHSFYAKIYGGILSLNGKNIGAGGYGYDFTGSIDLPSYQIFTFNNIPSSSIAAGSITYSAGYSQGGIRYSGAITNLQRIGVVAGYVDPSVVVVPELTTWAMVILGMGAIGFAMRRGRKSKISTAVSFA